MGQVLQALRLTLTDGTVFDNCTVELEDSYVMVNTNQEKLGPDRMDFVFPWSQVHQITLK